MKIRRLWFLALITIFVVVGAGAEGFDKNVLIDAGLNIEEVHVSIPGLTKTYHFLWVSDLHIVIDNEEITEENHEVVTGRQISWAVRPDGTQAGDYWVNELAEVINAFFPDAILFGGDMIDLCSEATVEKLKEGLEQITVPYMYIRADHDSRPYWTAYDGEKSKALQDSICENDEILILEYPEFIIVGINNSTDQMTEDAVEKAMSVAQSGKPLIIVTHVPYDSVVDKSLNEISRLAWQDRNLCWGTDTSYVPGEKMKEWLDVVFAENSPITEILAGHLHLTWDGMVTESVHEHVFSQAFSGNIRLITVDGE